MAKRNCIFILALVVQFSITFSGSENSFAKDKELKPEEVLAAHLKSIGNPSVLAGIKNRGLSGTGSVEFILGGTGKMAGQALVISAGSSLGIIMRFGGLEYPGEYFAYNGNEVTVGHISPGQRSPLADFIYRYNGLMKECLLGGVLSSGWSLLNVEQRKPTLRYDQAKIDGRELHQIEYIPKEGLIGMKIKLYFDKETFRHVRTEYRLKVQGEQALQADTAPLVRGAKEPITRPAGIQDAIPDSNYVLLEKFDNFQDENGLMLPHSYAIEYSLEGQGSSFLAHWKINASQFIHNGKIDQSFFTAH
jgi:hypothetical protein